jgi:MFS family permease
MSPGRRYGFGFWSLAAVFLTVIAFSTAPSPLYTLYRERDGFSALVVTIVYAAYAVGAVISLVLAGHLSDSHGRRRLLVPALLLEIVAAVVFLLWPALPGLLVARSLTGLGIGAFTSTATAWLGELHAAHRPRATNRRAQVVGTASNMWGFGVGTMVSGALAQWAGHPLTVPYLVFGIALVVGLLLVLAAPETRAPMTPRTRYRLQRVSVPPHVRGRYLAAATGMFVVFAALGLFSSLAPSYLSGPFHHPSVALAGAVTFVVFTAAVAAQLATAMIGEHRLLTTGIPILLVGLALLVAAVWLPTPSLAGFLTGGVVTGLGGGMVFRGTLSAVVTLAPENARAEALAGLFVAGYLGLTIPVIGLGLLMRYCTPQVSLLMFATALALAVLATTPALLFRTGAADERTPAPPFSEVAAFPLATAVQDGSER